MVLHGAPLAGSTIKLVTMGELLDALTTTQPRNHALAALAGTRVIGTRVLGAPYEYDVPARAARLHLSARCFGDSCWIAS